jgi:hypothetical protein
MASSQSSFCSSQRAAPLACGAPSKKRRIVVLTAKGSLGARPGLAPINTYSDTPSPPPSFKRRAAVAPPPQQQQPKEVDALQRAVEIKTRLMRTYNNRMCVYLQANPCAHLRFVLKREEDSDKCFCESFLRTAECDNVCRSNADQLRR